MTIFKISFMATIYVAFIVILNEATKRSISWAMRLVCELSFFAGYCCAVPPGLGYFPSTQWISVVLLRDYGVWTKRIQRWIAASCTKLRKLAAVLS
jgi:hypothetical protein